MFTRPAADRGAVRSGGGQKGHKPEQLPSHCAPPVGKASGSTHGDTVPLRRPGQLRISRMQPQAGFRRSASSPIRTVLQSPGKPQARSPAAIMTLSPSVQACVAART
jgi:hypothetical protein